MNASVSTAETRLRRSLTAALTVLAIITLMCTVVALVRHATATADPYTFSLAMNGSFGITPATSVMVGGSAS